MLLLLLACTDDGVLRRKVEFLEEENTTLQAQIDILRRQAERIETRLKASESRLETLSRPESPALKGETPYRPE